MDQKIENQREKKLKMDVGNRFGKFHERIVERKIRGIFLNELQLSELGFPIWAFLNEKKIKERKLERWM